MTAAPAGYSFAYFALKACPALRDEVTASELLVNIHLEMLSATARSHFYNYLGYLFFF